MRDDYNISTIAVYGSGAAVGLLFCYVGRLIQ
jgi:hypothetical protein